MYPVLLCSVALVACTGAKAWQLHRPRSHLIALLAAVDLRLSVGDLSGAVTIALRSRGALARVCVAALVEGLSAPHRIHASVAAALLDERAGIARGLTAFHRIAQIATLFGLLGSLTGLQRGFGCVANADASSRATALARGLSESLNCTAFGLLVSTAALGVGFVLHARAEQLDAELLQVAVALPNRLIDRRPRLRWLGARAPLERATYRQAC